jgi:hypothetical protein
VLSTLDCLECEHVARMYTADQTLIQQLYTLLRMYTSILLQELEALSKVTRLLESTINSSSSNSSSSSSSSSTASKSAREEALREIKQCHTAVEAMLRDENVEGEDRATATALRSKYAAILVRVFATLLCSFCINMHKNRILLVLEATHGVSAAMCAG